MIQLILHLWGDYILQSGWMANNKTKAWFPALAHATVYSLPFLLIGSLEAVLVIWSTHAVIDRFRLARYVCWAKDFIAPRWIPSLCEENECPACGISKKRNYSWRECSKTGYHETTPIWLSTWLMIIADNTLHLTINYLALLWL